MNKFILGIYNYCDRWCEHCLLFHRCFLYTKEKEKLEEHQKKGKDPNAWKIVMKDVEDSLKEAMELIKKVAEERGIDLDTLPEIKYELSDPHQHLLFRTAEKYRKLAHKFLRKLKDIIQEEGIDLTKRVEIMPSPEKEAGNFQEIVFCYQVILWYHTLVPAKIYRALSMPNSRDFDSDGSAKASYLGLTESIKALQKIYHWDKNLEDNILPLLITAEQLRKSIDREFPGHRHFKRPGFDK